MRRLKHIIYSAILLLGVVVTGCGSVVYDDRPCPPPSSHIYVVGPSRYYYPSGHPYHYRPVTPPPPVFKPTPPPPAPKPQPRPNNNGRRPATRR